MPLRILIVKDTLSARTGGTKLTIDIAQALRSSGQYVKIFFFHSDGSEQMLLSETENLPIEIYENRLLFFLSQLVQMPVFKLFLKDAFKPDDAVNLLGQISFARMLNKSSEKYDMVISMSIWTGVVLLFVHPNYKKRSVIYFHEPPTFNGLPFPVKFALRLYLHWILRKVAVNVSITERMKKSIVESLGIQSSVITDAFKVKPAIRAKEEYVLADTRWTFIRDPFFLIEIAKELPDVKFLMCGGFGSPDLRKRFMEELERSGLRERITVREENTEAELDRHYSRAMCYVRWASREVDETGPSYGLIQAVSNGCIPIVSSNLGSSDDVAEHLGGDFVVANEPAEFARAIRRLISDETFFSESYDKVIAWRGSYTGKEYAKRLISLINSGD